MDDYDHIVRAIARPLRFASKNDFAHLSAVKGLDELIPSLAAKAVLMARTPEEKNSFAAIRDSFARFYALDHQQQRQAILEALGALFPAGSSEYSGPQPEPGPAPDGDPPEASWDLLSLPVSGLKGVGPKTAEALARIDIRTVEDVLYHTPRTYVDRRKMKKICELGAGSSATVAGTVMAGRSGRFSRRAGFFELLVSDGSGMLTAKWFNVNAPFSHALKKKFAEGSRVLLSGQR